MAFRVLHGLLGNKNRINTVDLKVWVKHVFTLLIWKNIFFGSASASRFWLIFPNIARISSPNKEHLQTWTSIFRLLSMLGPIKSSPSSSSWSVSSEMIFQVHSSKLVYKFLLLPNSLIACKVAGKRMDRGGWYVLEIPVKYEFNGQDKTIMWIKKQLEKIMNDVSKKIEHCMSWKFIWSFFVWS